ncbi:hypothetical protein OsccyDRAFT_0839 [Leptolyngbyaceae cyanobacterium JSC-12]|nr:hypothetical protein OsccyDRAFT_0839 [Leptolyngbyaceae cyanobacterium JSC-12]
MIEYKRKIKNQGGTATIMRLSSNGLNKAIPSVQDTIQRINLSGQITRREHLMLTSALLSNQHLTDEDRLKINQVLDHTQLGKLKLVN